MACEIEWLDRAKADLRAILDYIAQDKPKAASGYVDDITESIGKLSDFPLSGRQLDRTYRSLVFRNHLVFYRYDTSSETITIVAVVDGRRDVARVLEGLTENQTR